MCVSSNTINEQYSRDSLGKIDKNFYPRVKSQLSVSGVQENNKFYAQNEIFRSLCVRPMRNKLHTGICKNNKIYDVRGMATIFFINYSEQLHFVKKKWENKYDKDPVCVLSSF